MQAGVGLDQLSDDQVLPLLLAMDADTLLNCGKASERLFNLICDRVVWRQELQNVKKIIHGAKLKKNKSYPKKST